MEYINSIEYYKHWLKQDKIPKLVIEEFKIDVERFKENQNEKNRFSSSGGNNVRGL